MRDPEKRREYQKRYRAAHMEEHRAEVRRYHLRHLRDRRKVNAMSPQEAGKLGADSRWAGHIPVERWDKRNPERSREWRVQYERKYRQRKTELQRKRREAVKPHRCRCRACFVPRYQPRAFRYWAWDRSHESRESALLYFELRKEIRNAKHQ